MKVVHIIDGVGDVLMEAKFRVEHYIEMVNRGWIKKNSWIRPDETIEVMDYQNLQLFFAEVAY